MQRKRHSAEIVAKLRQAGVLLAQGQTRADVARVMDAIETSFAMSCSTGRSSTRCEKLR
jgi:lambda repressor-like predicted transcriptional regulator